MSYCPFCHPDGIAARSAIDGAEGGTAPGWYVFHSETGYAVAGPFPNSLEANQHRHHVEQHGRLPGVRRCYDVLQVQGAPPE